MNIFSINCIEKTKIKKKVSWNGPLIKRYRQRQKLIIERTNREKEECSTLGTEITKKCFRPQISVTRLGDLLHFGQLFKACCNNYFAQNGPHFQAFFVKFWTFFILLVKSFLCNSYRHLAIFTGHTASNVLVIQKPMS